MKRRVFVRPVVSSIIVVLALTASAVAQEQPVLNASDVEGLYAAVNNPANAGAIVVLASGTYTLTAKDANNQARPNGGRLILQSGMALVGQNRYVDFDGDGVWDPRDDNNDGIPDTDPVRGLIFADPASETIIDAVKLSPTNIGAMRVGRDNRVEKLTVRNTNGLFAAIDVIQVPSIGGMQVEIRDCILEDGQRGIRLATPRLVGLDSSAVLERNISRRHLGFFGFGIQILHLAPSPNSSWDVILRNNLVYGNRVGLFVPGEGEQTNVQVHVLSMGNLYGQNQLGLAITAGRDGGNGNNTHFTSVRDGIFDNVGTTGVGGLAGGVAAMGGLNTSTGTTFSSNDALDLQFLGTRWSGNFQGTSRRDLQVYGALSLGGLPGTNDTVRVLIRQGTSDGAPGAFQFIDSQPGDPTNTDIVTVVGSNVAFDSHQRWDRSAAVGTLPARRQLTRRFELTERRVSKQGPNAIDIPAALRFRLGGSPCVLSFEGKP
jgi:hypothetical protein